MCIEVEELKYYLFTKNVVLASPDLELGDVQYIFDEVIYNYDSSCTSVTEKGIVVEVYFVGRELLQDMMQKYLSPNGMGIERGAVFVDTTISNLLERGKGKHTCPREGCLTYIEEGLRGTKVGAVGKPLTESDISYAQDVRNFRRFMEDLLDEKYKAEFVASLFE